jgi:DNA-binding NarL/FixJ family response regulator
MPIKPNTKVGIAKRRQRVADLYIQGWTQVAIAGELRVAQSTVSSDLKRIQQAWRESSIRDFDLARELELQKLIRIEREAWSAWAFNYP